MDPLSPVYPEPDFRPPPLRDFEVTRVNPDAEHDPPPGNEQQQSSARDGSAGAAQGRQPDLTGDDPLIDAVVVDAEHTEAARAAWDPAVDAEPRSGGMVERRVGGGGGPRAASGAEPPNSTGAPHPHIDIGA